MNRKHTGALERRLNIQTSLVSMRNTTLVFATLGALSSVTPLGCISSCVVHLLGTSLKTLIACNERPARCRSTLPKYTQYSSSCAILYSE